MTTKKGKAKFFRRISRQSRVLPDLIASSVADIDIDTLKKLKVGCMIIDIDDTLVTRRGRELDEHIAHHLDRIRHAGIELVVGSNTRRDITALAASINARTVERGRWRYKPMKYFFSHILATINLPPDRIVMVGDRVINDVVGAKRTGIQTILVLPLGRQLGWLARRYWSYLERHAQ